MTADTLPAPDAGAQDDGARALRAAAEAYERLRSLRAGFTMVVDNPLLRRTTTSRGVLYQRSPDRIKLAFTEPAGDVIVGDGAYFWIWYPSVDSLQVLRSPAAQGGAGVDLRAQFVGDPLTRFRYTLHGAETVAGRAARVLTLIPNDDVGYRQLKVWLDSRDGLARRFEITEHNGLTRRFDLDRLEINPNLEDAIFRFTPPPGARIIERE
ncbi:MAG: outer membrane lipoprotein carrier protein LolA [Gemmatimonadetes bacterium]|nr:outer membrane lipoprotein carrier protein LolA [Gemmatimonadota bacterium]